MKKRLLLSIGIFMLMTSNFNVALAEVMFTEEDAEEIVGNSIQITDEVVARVALDFANNFVNNKELAVSSITPIHDVDDNIISYDVGFEFDNKPHGYVILDFRMKEGFIAEFNLNSNTEDFFDQMANNLGGVIDERKLIETTPTEYNIINTENEVVSSNGEEMTLDEFENYKEDISDLSDEMLEENDVYKTTKAAAYDHASNVLRNYPGTTYKITESYYPRVVFTLSQQRATSVTGTYACAVSAMTIMSGSLGFLNLNDNAQLKSTYSSLWKKSKSTNDGAKRGGIQYGATDVANIGPAMVSLGADKKVKLSYKRMQKPTFTQIKNDVIAKKPIAFSYWYKNKAGQTSGHTVSVNGALVGTTGKTKHMFIALADGWGYDVRYMNYSTIPSTLVDYEATSISGKQVY